MHGRHRIHLKILLFNRKRLALLFLPSHSLLIIIVTIFCDDICTLWKWELIKCNNQHYSNCKCWILFTYIAKLRRLMKMEENTTHILFTNTDNDNGKLQKHTTLNEKCKYVHVIWNKCNSAIVNNSKTNGNHFFGFHFKVNDTFCHCYSGFLFRSHTNNFGTLMINNALYCIVF